MLSPCSPEVPAAAADRLLDQLRRDRLSPSIHIQAAVPGSTIRDVVQRRSAPVAQAAGHDVRPERRNRAAAARDEHRMELERRPCRTAVLRGFRSEMNR